MEEPSFAHRPRFELAKDRTHDLVWDRYKGDCLTLEELIQDRDYGQVIREERLELELEVLDGEPRYRCPHCPDAMVIRSKTIRKRTVRRFYFEHLSRRWREACTGRRGIPSKVILARKFGLNKEGALHKAFKEWVRDSLDADLAFSDTRLEARWWDMGGVKWRQPDVQTTFEGRRVAFEVQLSTTFVHVIAERMRFYRENEGRLLWLFKDLDVNEFRLAEGDIFYANNRNAFRVTPQTLERSRHEGRFMLECVWMEPCFKDGAITEDEKRDVVPFAQVIFDTSTKGIPRAYWFDYDAALERAEAKRADWREEQIWGKRRQAFETFYVALLRGELDEDHRERDRRWEQLRQSFASVGIELPAHPKGDTRLVRLLTAGYSATSAEGRPVGIGFSTLAELGHHIHKVWPEALWLYRCMLLAHRQLPVIKDQDRTGRFRGKVKKCLESLADGEPFFEPDRSWDHLLVRLFPEVASEWALDPSEVAREVLSKPRTARVPDQ